MGRFCAGLIQHVIRPVLMKYLWNVQCVCVCVFGWDVMAVSVRSVGGQYQERKRGERC